MGLRICNGSGARISVTIMFYNPVDCANDGGNFECMGWWVIDPGGCKLVYANDLADLNRYWYLFAYGGGLEWSGDFVRLVPSGPFAMWCWGTGSSSPSQQQEARYFEFDNGDADDRVIVLQ
jgi:uncharacterized membrane protein